MRVCVNCYEYGIYSGIHTIIMDKTLRVFCPLLSVYGDSDSSHLGNKIKSILSFDHHPFGRFYKFTNTLLNVYIEGFLFVL